MEVETNAVTPTPNETPDSNGERRDNLGRLLCLSTRKVCQQKRMDGYNFCVKHILEGLLQYEINHSDPNAPFLQCQHTTVYGKQCRNPVSTKDEQYVPTSSYLISKGSTNTALLTEQC